MFSWRKTCWTLRAEGFVPLAGNWVRDMARWIAVELVGGRSGGCWLEGFWDGGCRGSWNLCVGKCCWLRVWFSRDWNVTTCQEWRLRRSGRFHLLCFSAWPKTGTSWCWDWTALFSAMLHLVFSWFFVMVFSWFDVMVLSWNWAWKADWVGQAGWVGYGCGCCLHDKFNEWSFSFGGFGFWGIGDGILESEEGCSASRVERWRKFMCWSGRWERRGGRWVCFCRFCLSLIEEWLDAGEFYDKGGNLNYRCF